MKEKLKYFKWEVLYLIVTIIYLIKLYLFNLKLEKMGGKTQLVKILNQIDNVAINYFFIALILLTCGIIIIGHRIILIKNDKYNFDKMKLNLLGSLISFILVFLIIVFIEQYVVGIIFLLILVIGVKLSS